MSESNRSTITIGIVLAAILFVLPGLFIVKTFTADSSMLSTVEDLELPSETTDSLDSAGYEIIEVDPAIPFDSLLSLMKENEENNVKFKVRVSD